MHQNQASTWDNNKTLLARFCSSVWQSSENEDPEGDKKGRGRKVPSGFEKILKRTRKGITHESKEKDEKAAGQQDEEDSASKKDEKKAKEDSDDEKDEEEEKSKDKKKDKEGSSSEGFGQKVKGFFFEPNGGGPNYENWLKLAILGGITSYYTIFSKSPSQEVTYMDFVNNYLS